MKHAAESATNVVVGYVINLGLVYALLHWMGYQIQMNEKQARGSVPHPGGAEHRKETPPTPKHKGNKGFWG